MDLKKKFKGFELDIPELHIPKGYATALIGENGAGKSTLLNILAGIRLDHKGTLFYFDAFDEKERENGKNKERKRRKTTTVFCAFRAANTMSAAKTRQTVSTTSSGSALTSRPPRFHVRIRHK